MILIKNKIKKNVPDLYSILVLCSKQDLEIKKKNKKKNKKK